MQKLLGFLISSFFLIPFTTNGQTQKELLLLNSKMLENAPKEVFHTHQNTLEFTSNPFLLVGRSLLYVYQHYITQQLSTDCIFRPSCSEFSRQAIKRYGLLKGTFLSYDRLSRCNRYSISQNLKFIKSKDYKFYDEPDYYKIKE